TLSAIQAFFVAMALHPRVQKKAQAELDAVVGPDFSDSDGPVYLNALVKELLRWHVVNLLGVAHRTIEDDEFRGYFIPAGTSVFANHRVDFNREIMHDPETFDDPDEFRPERFMQDETLNVRPVPDSTLLAFGFRLRICPGRHFGHASLFIAVASVLHVFDIGLPLASEGRPIQIKYEQTHGFLSCRCTIKPRSAAAEGLVLD
ncbi:cytochrome P450, partial [Trametes maxima]